VYFYGVNGKRLAAYTLTAGVVWQGNKVQSLTMSSAVLTQDAYFGGRRLAGLDRVGSATQVGSQNVSFYPYGEDKGTPGANDNWKFGTYLRDSATGLDYAMNRYYSSGSGRFMSPDPYTNSAGPANPQSWNRYGYAGNDPVNRIDPMGLNVCSPDDGSDCGGDDDGGDVGYGGNPCDVDIYGDGFAPIPNAACYTGTGVVLAPVKPLEVPTYIEIAFTSDGYAEDCYTSVQSSSGALAQRDIEYEVLDQNFQLMSATRVREVLTIDSGVCPAGETQQGKMCYGTYASTNGTFLDTLSVNPRLSSEQFEQQFQVETMPGVPGYAGVSNSAVYIIGNYTDFGSSSNTLTLYPNKIGVNGAFSPLPGGAPNKCSNWGWAG
jgi:RHS repeat-associated protein